MGIAERMAALLIPSVGCEAVSDKSSSEARQNAYLIHCCLAAALIISVMGVSLGSGNMNPAAATANSETRFVCANDRGLADGSLYPLLAPDQLSRADAARTLDTGFGSGFGIVLQLLTHESFVPAFGLGKPALQQPLREHLSEFCTHVLFGVVAEASRQSIRKQF
jgi:Protein of unknown function (DUF1440)